MLPAAAEALRTVLEDRLLLQAMLPILKGAPLSPEDHAEHARALPQALAAAGVRAPLLAACRAGPLWAALLPPLSTDPPSPEVAHHLALLHARFAETTTQHEAAVAHLERALVLWLWLWGQGTYLHALAAAIAGEGGPALLAGLPEALLEPLATALRVGRREPTPAARRAMAVLRAAGGLAARAGLPAERCAAVAALAARLRGAVVHEVVDEARIVAEQVDPLRASPEERAAPFQVVLAFTTWAGFDPETLVFLLDQAQDQAWELYRVHRMPEVRALLEPLRPAIDELEARIAKDTDLLAYRALSAQMFTFLGETEGDLRAAIALLERAVAVCPTHRNARLILAGFLLEDATRRLAGLPTIGLFGASEVRRRGLEELRRLRDRALELWPEAKVPAPLAQALLAATPG